MNSPRADFLEYFGGFLKMPGQIAEISQGSLFMVTKKMLARPWTY